VLDRGRLVAVGTPDAVLTPALVRTVFQHEVLRLSHPDTGRPVLVPAQGMLLPVAAPLVGVKGVQSWV
jgi:ferric hydroxamate transport system ATP-binding protein